MQLLTGDTAPLRIWRQGTTDIGIQLAAEDPSTGKPMTSAQLTALTGKLAVLADGTSPTSESDAAYVTFTWQKWADDYGQVIDVAVVNVANATGTGIDTTWPATDGLVRVWWQLSDGTRTRAGQADGAIDLYT